MYDIYIKIEPLKADDATVEVNVNGRTVSTINKQLIHSTYSPDMTRKVREPKIVLERGTIGVMSFKVPVSNACYDFIMPYSTFWAVDVTAEFTESGVMDDSVLFEGRLGLIKMDFNRNKYVEVDSGEDYSNDSVIGTPDSPITFQGTLFQTFSKVIELHNTSVASYRYKQFIRGVINELGLGGDNYSSQVFTSSFDGSPLSTYLKGLKETFGGYFKILYETRNINGQPVRGRFIDYLKDDVTENGGTDNPRQEINFGINLLDFSKEMDYRGFYTQITPYGGSYQSGSETTQRHNIARVNGGAMFINASQEITDKFGLIRKNVIFDEIGSGEQPSDDISNQLKTVAANALNSQLNNKIKLEINALDLHYLNPTIKRLDIHCNVRVISIPHGIDCVLPVRKIEMDLAEPNNNKYTISNEVSAPGYSSGCHSSDTISAQMAKAYFKNRQF